MAISRQQLLEELLPGLNALFGMEYKSYERRQREAIGGNEYVHAAGKWVDPRTAPKKVLCLHQPSKNGVHE